MNIQTKITLRFAGIVASILVLFSLSIYLASENYRREEFYTRLESRAITTARLFVTVQEVDQNLLKIIDKNSIHAMFQEKVLVFGPDNQLKYSSLDDLEVDHSPELLEKVRIQHKIEYTQNGVENVGLIYESPEGNYVVFSSAVDRYGRSKLNNLRYILIIGLIVGIFITVIAGMIFARLVLQPIARLNAEVSKISAGNLSHRVGAGNERDEMAQLAGNFNKMLRRLEASFAVQQQFVSNASHELRTPLAAISTQLQLLLKKERTPEYYHQALQSLLDDTQTLIELTNGLLTLAQSDLEKQQLRLGAVRIDETLFAAQNDLLKQHPNYQFLIEYDSLPDDESLFIIHGNEHLLRTAFLNLMDNACKFSDNHAVQVNISAHPEAIHVAIKDQGMGIPEGEQDRIFAPFYRGSNTPLRAKGHGIGLSLCQRIIALHNGSIVVESVVGTGSCFKVQLPRTPHTEGF